MSEMIERIAKAVRRRQMKRVGTGKHFDKAVPSTEYELDDVRVMLQALRESTEEMRKAGAESLEDWEDLADFETRASLAFRAMVDEALQ